MKCCKDFPEFIRIMFFSSPRFALDIFHIKECPFCGDKL